MTHCPPPGCVGAEFTTDEDTGLPRLRIDKPLPKAETKTETNAPNIIPYAIGAAMLAALFVAVTDKR